VTATDRDLGLGEEATCAASRTLAGAGSTRRLGDEADGGPRSPLPAAVPAQALNVAGSLSRGLLPGGLFAPDPPQRSDPLEQPRRPRRGRGPRPRRRGVQLTATRHACGHARGALPATGRPRDLAWPATLRALVSRQGSRRPPPGLAFCIGPDELLLNDRRAPPGHLVLLVVDASGSMGGRLTALARDLALQLLRGAYVARAQVAMIVFCGRRAVERIAPSARVGRVASALIGLHMGGTTPLGPALRRAAAVLARARRRDPGARRSLVLLSDGRANVGARPGHAQVLDELERAARHLARAPDLRILHLDPTEAGKDDREAAALAQTLGATRLRLADLSPGGGLLRRLRAALQLQGRRS
jgi:magnesium chelatase subunit D